MELDMYDALKPMLDKFSAQLDSAITSTILYRNIMILNELAIEHKPKYLEQLKTNKGIGPEMLNTLNEYYRTNLEKWKMQEACALHAYQYTEATSI